jgi:integration host factor subunit beta
MNHLLQERIIVTKKEIANAIAEETQLPQTLVKEIIEQLFDGIIKTLETEGRIELRNFGVFEVKRRKPRKARNPRTGEEVMVPARLAVSFKQGREMEQRVAKVKKLKAKG